MVGQEYDQHFDNWRKRFGIPTSSSFDDRWVISNDLVVAGQLKQKLFTYQLYPSPSHSQQKS